jgi:hypothetical protein
MRFSMHPTTHLTLLSLERSPSNSFYPRDQQTTMRPVWTSRLNIGLLEATHMSMSITSAALAAHANTAAPSTTPGASKMWMILDQAEEMTRILKEGGKDVKFVVFQGEGHGFAILEEEGPRRRTKAGVNSSSKAADDKETPLLMKSICSSTSRS